MSGFWGETGIGRARAAGLRLTVCIALALAASLGLSGCKAKENSIKAEAVVLVTQVKQAKGPAELIVYASPAFQHAAIKAGETLGLTADKLLPLTSFPLNIQRAVTLPEAEELA
ncbi:MAG: hypothetical protein HRF49_05455, partial [bacterium]